MNQVMQDNQLQGEYQLRDTVKSIGFFTMKSLTNCREITERNWRKSMNWKKKQERRIKKVMI